MSEIAIQTRQAPFDELSLVESYAELLRAHYAWSKVGVLSDGDHKNTVVILVLDDHVVAALRLNLSASDSVKAINCLASEGQKTEYGHYQGYTLSKEEVCSLESLNKIWETIKHQIVACNQDEIFRFFYRLEENSKVKGRAHHISNETKRKVLQFSHGRCMFTGCGEDLEVDQITGHEGNFSYLAHNVASSEQGERGGILTSEKLSNDPSNILLLCDKHHRLIDKVAAADFPATELSRMRSSFKDTACRLLDGLQFEPVPTFAVLWPVGGNVIAPPTNFQISQALQVIEARAEGRLNVVTQNDDSLLSGDSSAWAVAPRLIDRAAEQIVMQTRETQHRAAIFAFGLMPQLIGLGAKLGNKAQFIPMLRSRDTGTWAWPSDRPRYDAFSVLGEDQQDQKSEEIAVAISLTAKPELFDATASYLGLKLIEITVPDGYLGNGAISHPEEGKLLLNELHALLHRLSESGVKRVHLFACASNCASVFTGMAIDQNHPSVTVYDFSDKNLVPRLLIDTAENPARLSAASQ